ncbi:hypothetical protein OG592_27150 [Streptomyces avidinii]|uniref:hypothetical protein n=1 Tax=Streptomyces avidinii TaxID=1895 RepID=UPI00386555F8|nr:hypothetical protein OG592_27150 [Streptomyces avidinii]
MSDCVFSLLIATAAQGRFHLCDDVTVAAGTPEADTRDGIIRDWADREGIDPADATVLGWNITPA